MDSQNKEYLARLHSLFGTFRIARHDPADGEVVKSLPAYSNGKLIRKAGDDLVIIPWKYTTTSEREDKSYNHRDILPGEIVWECDSPELLDNVVDGLIIFNKLLNDGIIAQAWLSGNKSLHVSTFFNTDGVGDLLLFRRCVFEHYAGDINVDRALLGHHLIRAEYGVHEKTGKHKGLLVGPPVPIINELPDFLWKRYEQELFIRSIKEQKKQYKRQYNHYTHKAPRCVSQLESEEYFNKGDGMNRGLFIMADIYAKYCETPEEGMGRLKAWNNKLKKPFRESYLKYHFNKATTSVRHVGCPYIHELLRELGLSPVCETFKSPDHRKENTEVKPQ